MRIAVTGVLAILALFLFVRTMSGLQDLGHADAAHLHTIAVTGTGKSTAVPNVAHISFTVQESAATVAAAQDAATKRTNDALAALKKEGIDDKDVTTTGYNVNPQYATKACPPGAFCQQSNTITGYQVSQSVTVKVRDTAKAGTVLQDLGTLGVQNISGPDFSVDDDSTVRDAARAEAIKDARARADVLAKELGVHLGKVVSFTETSGPNPIYQTYGKSATMDSASVAAAPSLPTGTDETSVSVVVEYEIR